MIKAYMKSNHSLTKTYIIQITIGIASDEMFFASSDILYGQPGILP